MRVDSFQMNAFSNENERDAYSKEINESVEFIEAEKLYRQW